MARQDPGPVNLERIVAPAEPPLLAPDELTAQEEAARQHAKKPTPTEHIVASKDKHIDDACAERDRIRVERESLRREVSEQANRITNLSYENATFKQQLSDTRAVFGFSAIAQSVGAVSVSIAGAMIDLFWKPLFLWSGCAQFVWGLLLAWWSLLFVGKRRGRI